jgi:hypothetical protein
MVENNGFHLEMEYLSSLEIISLYFKSRENAENYIFNVYMNDINANINLFEEDIGVYNDMDIYDLMDVIDLKFMNNYCIKNSPTIFSINEILFTD